MKTMDVEITSGNVTATYTAVVPDDNNSFGETLDKEVEGLEVEINDSCVVFVVQEKPATLFAKLWLDKPGKCKVTGSDGNVISHFKYKFAALDGHLIVLQGIY